MKARTRRHAAIVCLVWAGAAVLAAGQQSQRRGPTTRELEQAEHDIPKLFEVLAVQPGMTIADVGAGAGAMTLVASRQLGPNGRVYATDVNTETVGRLRELKSREQLANVDVIEGGIEATNLPDACCDAIFLRDVYHHFTAVGEMNRSLAAALKPGGRLAIIDFEAKPRSKAPDGVPANRTGHGVSPDVVVDELKQASLTFDRTIPNWPDGKANTFFLVLFRKP